MANRVMRPKGRRFTHKLEAYVEETMRDEIETFCLQHGYDSTAQGVRALLQAGLHARMNDRITQKSDDKPIDNGSKLGV